jgi:hypothetical protein
MKHILLLPLLLLGAFAAFGQITTPDAQRTPAPTAQAYDFQTIDFPAATATRPLGINNCGELVGLYVDPDGNQHGFLFSGKDGFKAIDVPSAAATGLFGINDSYDVVGGWLDASGLIHDVLLSKGKFIPINFPSAVYTSPQGINDQGQFVGAYTIALGGLLHGFIASHRKNSGH